MKRRILTLVLALTIVCGTCIGVCIGVANTTQVYAVQQYHLDYVKDTLIETKKSDVARYNKISTLVMNEIRDGAWSTEQIADLIDNGCLSEYKDELTSLGYYVSNVTQESTNGGTAVTSGAGYSAVFNAEYYYNKYPDLQANIGTDSTALLNHFITVGMVEGRQASTDFNLDVYKKNNPDLVKVFETNNVAYYNHYITAGKAEKRIAK